MGAKKAARSKPKLRKLPWLFGRGGADRALICLAVNGPLTVRELGRATNIDSHKIYDIVERLRSRAILVKRDRPGGRKYVSLNRQLVIYRPLFRLLKALDEHWPAKRVQNYIARWHMPFDPVLDSVHLDCMFQSPVRSRVLLFIAAVGETNLSSIYTMLGLAATSVWLVVNHWEKQGVIRTRRFKTHRLLSLNPHFIVAKELKALLRAVVAASNEYHELRAACRTQLRALLKDAKANTAIPKRVSRRPRDEASN
jgi:hypothetical protein